MSSAKLIFRLLIWLGVILFLASLVIPTNQVLINRRSTRAEVAMKGLEIAINAYKTEYDKLPHPLLSAADETTPMRSEGLLIALLLAEDETENLRKIKFYDPLTAKSLKNGLLPNDSSFSLVDPWGERYYLLADKDQDGEIIPPVIRPYSKRDSKSVSATVLIYSSGPDKNPKTWSDNVISWKR